MASNNRASPTPGHSTSRHCCVSSLPRFSPRHQAPSCTYNQQDSKTSTHRATPMEMALMCLCSIAALCYLLAAQSWTRRISPEHADTTANSTPPKAAAAEQPINAEEDAYAMQYTEDELITRQHELRMWGEILNETPTNLATVEPADREAWRHLVIPQSNGDLHTTEQRPRTQTPPTSRPHRTNAHTHAHPEPAPTDLLSVPQPHQDTTCATADHGSYTHTIHPPTRPRHYHPHSTKAHIFQDWLSARF
ncbi:hypothetical protein CYMTET_39500 [Cymbomonas tetramitiformis]|uniref:Uncharacterized protein n=1 Tax=Cymbomonas tetramitiformis TaxID=36881 RepID=A0AAE0CB49_9CHLO|nr:hypothetical protein CYMTET_39500 [Cymbomonas tetramitiformis]